MSDGIIWETLPVAVKAPDVEMRKGDYGGLSICLLKLDRGHDTRPLFQGMPDDLCQIPHWGYIVRGNIRLWTRDGFQSYRSGDAFYWAPGHAPEALEDSEYVEISNTREYDALLEHLGAG